MNLPQRDALLVSMRPSLALACVMPYSFETSATTAHPDSGVV